MIVLLRPPAGAVHNRNGLALAALGPLGLRRLRKDAMSATWPSAGVVYLPLRGEDCLAIWNRGDYVRHQFPSDQLLASLTLSEIIVLSRARGNS